MRLLVETSFDASLATKIDPADLVQDTLLKAHAHLDQFRGSSEAELAAWVRQILARKLIDAARRFHVAEARDVRRERSLEELLDRSSQRFGNLLVQSGTTPSEAAQKRERGVILADALAQIATGHRQVIVLHSLRELSWDEVATQMQRTPDAVRMLWVRALKQLRPLIEARLR